jgi:excisionase family DNA binding protein
MTEPLLTTAQVAEYLQVPVATVHRWRYFGTGPPAIKVGRHLRFEPSDLRDWIDEKKANDASGRG